MNLTRPDIIAEIHLKYLLAGADIIETNTFNSNQTSQSDYKCEHITNRLNFEGAKIAKNVALKFKKQIK